MSRALRFSEKNFPFALLVIGLLVYGPFMPWLGFYWDDWPVILMGKFFGTSAFAEFYTYDRPFSAWTYIVSLLVLGLHPLAWQLYTFTLHFLSAVFFWLTLRRIWPAQRNQTAWMAVLFLVHPIFTLQFISVAFSQHWTCALLYSFSLWAMLESLRSGARRWLWQGLALAACALHLWTMEYFVGMEIFRYAVLWLINEPLTPARERVVVVIKRALPYSLILIVYIVWRLFILQLPGEDPNPVQFLTDLRTQPLAGLTTLTQIILRDLIYMLVQVWANILDPARVQLAGKFFFLSALFSSIVAGFVGLYFRRLTPTASVAPDQSEPLPASPGWAVQAMRVGVLGILLGTLPGWVTYREVLNEPYGNRIAIPALLGLGILIVAFIDWVSQNQNRKLTLLSLLCGLSMYSHLYSANAYRETWNIQRDFYWQLAWRVPALQPGTALLADSEVVLGASDYSTAAAINLIYAREFDIEEFPYWFFNMEQGINPQMERLLEGKTIRQDFRNWHFEGDADKILLIDNSLDSCMQVLASGQAETTELTPFLNQILPLVNLSRIITEPKVPAVPPIEIFGPEPVHTWCYYYQKASLARQSGDWEKVIALGKQADQEGYEPVKTAEWLLFVDAYVQAGDITAAEELSIRTQTRDPRLTPLLCTYWSQQTALPTGLSESLMQKLECVESVPGN